VIEAALLELFRADVATGGARIEEHLAALGGGEATLALLAQVARDARAIAGAARLLGIEPAARVALALEGAAGAGARGAITIDADATLALLAATSLLARIAAASAHLAGWMVAHGAEVDAAVAAIAQTTGLPPARGEARPRVAREPPRATTPPYGTDPASVARTGRTRRDVSVLLVDDQPMIAEAVRQMLANEPGLRLHHCFDAAAALATAAAVQPTVILQDLVMPDVDGLTLIRYFRAAAATRDVPIIALSTRDEPAVKADAFQAGANDYVVKLPDRLELVARVRYLSKGYLHQLDSQEAWAALLATQEQLEIRNRFIRETFGRYHSDEIVEGLLEKPGGLELGGETRRVTILITDLRGFVPLCEALEPRQVVTMLNNYLGAMIDVVVRHGGTIDEFIGDAILVVFGAPLAHPDDARRAVACAIEMQETMDQVNAQNASLGLPRIEMGIGLHTGEVVVGNIGSHKRAKYGVVGRTVNLASRIESFTIGGQILATSATIADAGDDIQVHGQMEIMPKGSREALTIHDVAGIGAPYHRRLASRHDEPLVPLTPPLAVNVLVLEGKRVHGEGQPGELVALSSRIGRVRSDRPVAAMQNVRLELREPELWGIELWGKTLAPREPAGEPGFDVWLLSLPEEVSALLARREDASRG
jgi:adenylate cyclase